MKMKRHRPGRFFNKDTRYKYWLQQGGLCSYCDQPVEFESSIADHFFPWHEVRTSRQWNIVVCCQPCNIAKGRETFNYHSDAKTYIQLKRGLLSPMQQAISLEAEMAAILQTGMPDDSLANRAQKAKQVLDNFFKV